MDFNLNSLRFKISVLAMVILAVILTAYTAFLFISLRYMLYDDLDSSIRAKAQKVNNAVISYLNVLGRDRQSFDFVVQRVVSQSGTHPHKNKIDKLEQLWLGQAQPMGLYNDYVLFVNSRGSVFSRSRSLHGKSDPINSKDVQAALKSDDPIFRDFDIGKQHLRLIYYRVSFDDLSRERNFVIVVATSREKVIQALNRRLLHKVLGVTMILAFAFLLSELFARRILKPIQEITRATKSIDYKDLSMRVKVENVDIEMKELVNSLNEMMARLEKSFKYIAQFSSHVSHELKTPLAILRGESEFALRSDRSPEEYRQVLKSSLEEISRMTKIIDDLLLLTKLDYQPEVFHFERFDLVEFFREINDSAKILAEPKGLEVQTDLPQAAIYIRGDRVHLRRLFFNLINNAIKFTAEGAVKLTVKGNGKQAYVSVADTGVGIPSELLPQIFEKFFHYESYSTDSPGNGLGLSIAQSIARIHDGDIQVQSATGKGSTFTVRLPLS
jgi:two-component system, OmpR family, heavy metal sensor histidine kinase CusS